VIVNEAFVRRHSPDRDPIGRELLSNGVRTIVGVVGDIQTKVAFGNFGPIGAAPAAYIPAAQTTASLLNMVHTWFSPSFFVRTAGPQQGIAADMQRAVQGVDPFLPFAAFRTLEEIRGEAVASERAQATILGALAGLALLLAAVGLYGVVAIAAWPGAALAAIGVVIGLAAARAGATTLGHLVWGVGVGDPLTFTVAGGLVLGVAVVAALVPSLRLARLNPITALRQA
jgi:hypothetical protein